MSKLWKIILSVVGIAIILLICVLSFQWWKSSNEVTALYNVVVLKEAEITKTKNEFGQEVATFKADVLDKDLLLCAKDSIIEGLKEDVKNWKNLYSYTLVELETLGEIQAEVMDSIVYRDRDVPVYVKVFSWKDDWMSMNGIITDTAEIKYKLRNSIAVSYDWHRDHWYSKQYLQGQVVNHNPNTTTNRVITFVAKPEEKFYDKWWFQMGMGVLVGGAGTYFIMK